MVPFARTAALLLASLILGGASAAAATAPDAAPERPFRSVRFVYLVSADRPVRSDFRDAVAAAAVTVQRFYAEQLGGPTFTLGDPVVEIALSDKPAAWFYTHDPGNGSTLWGHDNGLAEVRRLLGAGHGQDFIWVIYSDGPGDQGAGGGGVCVMPEDDLLGLVGRHPTQKDPRRWVYGMAHELGHALGLSHPADLAAAPNAIMGAGFYTCFPDRCELTPDDLALLRHSPFIRPAGAAARPPRTLAVYTYDGGRFERVDDGGRVRWLERGSGGGRFTFDQAAASKRGFLLYDPSRGLHLRIPRAGGQSAISSDGGVTWRDLYVVTPARPPAN
ncbi:MAG: hypothetical protein CVU56_24750 [Deltaproteobacteria bacterium HGW-Deltaproteobacteria-14]|jgi:hypothetical protein|nr:MAG: hypothetical protein CVU56_24750 [Deltaproteobacteria bacterium HGW-Deltaproteobacteria-14]